MKKNFYLFAFVLLFSVAFTKPVFSQDNSVANGEKDGGLQDELSYVPDQLLVHFYAPVWVFPTGKKVASVQELKETNPQIAGLLKKFHVYQVQLQFDVDGVLEQSRNKYPEAQWLALSAKLPALRHRYLLYLENSDDLQPLKSALDQLKQAKQISYNYYHKAHTVPDDYRYSAQWWLPAIGMETAWDIATDSSTIPVGITDGGFQEDHADLVDNVTKAYDSVDEDDDPTAGSGLELCDEHGTHVAGIVGAVGNNEADVSGGVSGVNWNASLYLYRIGTRVRGSECFSTSSSDEAAIADAIADGVRVINHSFGYGLWILNDISGIQDVALFVNSAGNGGSDGVGDDDDLSLSAIRFARLSNTLQVASARRTGAPMSSSDYGNNTVHLAAYGSGIWSTVPTDDYDLMSGTSMAAPMVSGVAALAWSLCPALTVSQIRQVILDSVTVDTAHWAGLTVTEGIVNGYNALIEAQSTCSAADLTVSNVSLDTTTGMTGTTFTPTLDIQNAGDADAASFTISIVFSSDTTFSTSEDAIACSETINSYLGDGTTIGLPAGTTLTSYTLTGCAVPSVVDGTWYVGAIVDSDGVISESDESNNTGYSATLFVVSTDFDGDGYSVEDGDCNDADASIHPGAAETCDSVDQDCDTVIDDGLTYSTYYPDYDSDGYGDEGSSGTYTCAPLSTEVANNGDCDDFDASINPGATEICDGGVDNNCDGVGETSGFNPVYVSYDADDEILFSATRPCGYSGNDDDGNIEPGERAEVEVTIQNNTDCYWDDVDGEIGVVSPLSAILKYDGSSGADYDWWGSISAHYASDGSGEFCISVDSAASCDVTYDMDLRVYDGSGSEAYLTIPFYVSCP